MPEYYEFKPKKNVFLVWHLVYATFIRFIILTVLAIAGWFLTPYISLALVIIFILITFYSIINMGARYRKEWYRIYPTKIVRHHGGLLSDSERELVIRNITHVRLVKPWLRHKLFGVGTITIDSAGSGFQKVTFFDLHDEEKVYAYMQKVMQTNGFRLTKKNVLQEETPATAGIVLEMFKGILIVFILLFFIGKKGYLDF